MVNTLSLRRFAWVALTVLLVAVPVSAQDLASFEEKTSTHVLDNGWTFVIVNRPVAPVFSYATFADVGGAQEVPGITGLAHMFEHMAFKGTPNIGTTDYEAEKVALAELEDAYAAYQRARTAVNPDEEEVQTLLAAFEAKQEEAAQYVVPNEFDEALSRQGGTGLNAFTNSDATGYFFSLPSNRFELFAFLESERFFHPVFREFYKERDVVQEERRLRTESQPIGRMIEQFLATAFVAHPYKQPVVGYMSDLQSFTATDAQEFFEKYYGPSNLTTVIVGDVTADEVLPVLKTYFERIPARPKPEALRTVEPPQIAEKTVVLEDPSQPVYVEGYHKPAATHADQPVWDAIDDILSGGRASRLYRSLVEDKKIAAQTGSFASFPGSKYPTMWIAFAIPSPGVENEEVQAAIREEIERLKTELVTDDELERFKTKARANLLRGLRNNQGLAFNLVQYQTWYGDWREAFRYVDRIDEVTAEDIQRVVNETLTPTNRTVAMIKTAEEEAEAETDTGTDTGTNTGEDA